MAVASQQEQFRKLASELQMMQGSAETLQQRLGVLQNAATDLGVAKTSIDSLKSGEKGDPILVPTGGGTFVKAKLGDLSTILITIGADVSIEMGLDDAEQDLSERFKEVEKARQSVQNQLQQILGQMEVHRDVLNRLSASLQGVEPAV